MSGVPLSAGSDWRDLPEAHLSRLDADKAGAAVQHNARVLILSQQAP